MIDIHAHILPDIDDGAQTMRDSVEMVRELAKAGATDIIATPHYVDETIYTSPRDENEKLLDELRRELANEGVGVELHLGNEIYLNEKIAELVGAGEVATLAGGEYLLVELPMSGEYAGYEDTMRDLMAAGYKVILAHPERYIAVQNDFTILQNLREMGVLLQCNLGSIIGKYGKRARKVVRKLAKEKMIFAFGSDIHHCQGADYWALAQKKLGKYYGEPELEQVLVGNPRGILGR